MRLPFESGPNVPYLRLAGLLRGKIARGELVAGEKLPSARQLQRTYGVASSTVQNALRALKGQGLVASEQGRGTFVLAGAAEILAAADDTGGLADAVRALGDQVGRLASRVDALERRLGELERSP